MHTVYDRGNCVLGKAPSPHGIPHPVFLGDIDLGLLDLPGKCRHGLQTENADPGLSVYVHRGRMATVERKTPGQEDGACPKKEKDG